MQVDKQQNYLFRRFIFGTLRVCYCLPKFVSDWSKTWWQMPDVSMSMPVWALPMFPQNTCVGLPNIHRTLQATNFFLCAYSWTDMTWSVRSRSMCSYLYPPVEEHWPLLSIRTSNVCSTSRRCHVGKGRENKCFPEQARKRQQHFLSLQRIPPFFSVCFSPSERLMHFGSNFSFKYPPQFVFKWTSVPSDRPWEKDQSGFPFVYLARSVSVTIHWIPGIATSRRR